MDQGEFSLRTLVLSGFRSIRDESVELSNPLFLVGRNGAGKSNIVDALAFLNDCARQPLTEALGARGGLPTLAWRFARESEGRRVGLRADFQLRHPVAGQGGYAMQLGDAPRHGFKVIREQGWFDDGIRLAWFDRRGDKFRSNLDAVPAVDPQALVLPIIGGTREFAAVLKAFAGIRTYNIQPELIRVPQSRNGMPLLEGDGRNLAGVIHALATEHPVQFSLLLDYLPHLVPATDQVMVRAIGEKLWLQFRQTWGRTGQAVFDAAEMSDGLLRAMGLLAAVLQRPLPTLIAMEEPEATIHPEALGVVLDMIHMAAGQTQIIVTTHSPDVIEAKWIAPEQIRIVVCDKGATRVEALSADSVQAIRSHLMGAGEQFRSLALEAERAAPRRRTSTTALFRGLPS